MIAINVKINGEKKSFNIHPGEILADFLRNEGYFGVKKGCSTGDCGSCAVILNGRAVNSCLLFAAQIDGGELTTIEGIGTPDNLHPLQEEMIKTGGVQCGFCVPGIIISAKVLLDKNTNPTTQEIKETINGNLCRCTGYVKQIEAIKNAARRLGTGRKTAGRKK